MNDRPDHPFDSEQESASPITPPFASEPQSVPQEAQAFSPVFEQEATPSVCEPIQPEVPPLMAEHFPSAPEAPLEPKSAASPSDFEAPAQPEPAKAPEQAPVYSAPRPYAPYPPRQPVGHAPSQPKKPAPKKKKRKGLALAVAAIALCCGLIGSICGGLLVGFAMRDLDRQDTQLQTSVQEPSKEESKEPTEKPQTVPPTQVPGNELSASGLYTPAQVYANNVSAVVGISNEGTSYNVFGQASETASSGSGFIISADGEILTNYHVVEGAQTLTVTLYDGREYSATVLGYEADSDIALIQIDETDLPFVSLGDSDLLYVGDEVAAIGNPLGELTYSMTVGYVSAMDRYVNTDGTPINMMQIDAAINSGNSGGPLFDMNGTVVGITTAKYSGTTGSGTTIEGIGFAIPINDVTAILEDLRVNGAVLDRAYMGVIVSTVTDSDIDRFGVPQGVLIESVESGSSAYKAGLEKGDILLEIDSVKLTTYEDLSAALRKYRAGDTAVLSVYRDGETMEMEITFDAKPVGEEEEEVEETTEFDPWDYIFPNG